MKIRFKKNTKVKYNVLYTSFNLGKELQLQELRDPAGTNVRCQFGVILTSR